MIGGETMLFHAVVEAGLPVGVWSRDGQNAMRVAKKLRAGQVSVNSQSIFRQDEVVLATRICSRKSLQSAGGGVELPFGGVKKSGHGREKGLEALNEFSAVKTVVFNHG